MVNIQAITILNWVYDKFIGLYDLLQREISVPDEAGGEKEYIYPDETPSDAIVLSTSANEGIQLGPTYQERFIEGIEEVKAARVEEVEVEAGIARVGHLRFKIKRAPQKTIIRYAEQQKSRNNK